MDCLDYPEGLTTGRLAEMWVRDTDDWSGVTDSQRRRRIQNRRNQRAYRAKRRAAFNDKVDQNYQDTTVQTTPSSPTTLVYRQPNLQVLGGTVSMEAVDTVMQTINSVNILTPHSELNRRIMQRFEEYAVRCYMARSQKLGMLPSLSQFNFIRALLANVDVLGLSAKDMDDDALSPFNMSIGPAHVSSQREKLSRLPAGLRPTDLQRETPHHPWVDLIPVSAMRDNLFRRGFDFFDEEQLCHDMRGAIPGQNPGVLVWGDPWDPDAWEVTEEFVRSWGWVIANCWGLLRSTNRWRLQRGEKPLFSSRSTG